MPPRSPARPVGASPLLRPRFRASRLAWLVAPALVFLAAAGGGEAGDVRLALAITDSVQLNAVFRVEGDEEELGSMLVRGIDSSGIGPGELSETFVMRSSLGYTGEQPRAQMLQHKEFRDVQVELFAKHKAKQWVKIGQYRIDRQLLTR